MPGALAALGRVPPVVGVAFLGGHGGLLSRGICNPTLWSIRIFNPKKYTFSHIIVLRTCKPLRVCGFGNPHFCCAGFGNPSQQDSRSFLGDKMGKIDEK